MAQPPKQKPLVGCTIAIMAVFLAVSLGLAGLYLQARQNATTSGPLDGETNIEGISVSYKIYSDEVVELVPLASGEENNVTGGVPPDAVPPTTLPPTAVPPTALPPTPTPDKIIFTSYTVQNGDTLYSIAAAFGWTSTISLMAKYNIAADSIVPGTVLSPFPVANPAYCPNRRPYVVEESESAYTIAQTVGTTIDTLKEINNLDDQYTVYVTDVLCVP